MKRRWRWSVACLVVTLVVMAYSYKTRPRSDQTLTQVHQSGVLRIGMDASFPPFGNMINNETVGLDADLANALGQRLGVKVQIQNMGFDGLYYALESHQVDAVISALSIDPVRTGDVIYTRPYIDVGQVLVS